MEWLNCLFLLIIVSFALYLFSRSKENSPVQQFNDQVNKLHKEDAWLEIAELHLKGDPDNGIKPNHADAIIALEKAATKSPKGAFMLAELLENGFSTVVGDSNAALQWYKYISEKFPNDVMYYTRAISRINVLSPPPVVKEVVKELFFPDPKLNLNISHAPKIRILTYDERIRQEDREHRRAQRRLANIQRTHFWLPQQPIQQPQSLDFDRASNDAQNIHNTSVASTVANSVKKLKQTTEIKIPSYEVLYQVRKLIKPYSYLVLDSMEMNFVVIERLGMTEVEVLTLVYNRIMCDKFDDENRKTLIGNLIKAFEDSVEDGRPVCIGGRIARLVDVLNVLDDDVKIQPAWSIREEMMAKCSRIREQIDSTDDDNQLKEEIRKQLYSDYVATGILQEAQFHKELNQWIDYI
jgi:hypothetical protein